LLEGGELHWGHSITGKETRKRERPQAAAGDAFGDLLKKHRRPTTLKETLRESAGAAGKEEGSGGPTS
jgi:hypothetical protein